MPVVQVSPGSEVAGKLNAKINRKHGALAKLPTDDSSATFYERLLHFSSNTSLHGWSFLLSKVDGCNLKKKE